MGQRRSRHFLTRNFCIALALAGAVGCDRPPQPAPTTSAARITVASLVPAATDLIIGMQAADQRIRELFLNC